jgi:hypothetical protein
VFARVRHCVLVIEGVCKRTNRLTMQLKTP